jgi:hypothetical protein
MLTHFKIKDVKVNDIISQYDEQYDVEDRYQVVEIYSVLIETALNNFDAIRVFMRDLETGNIKKADYHPDTEVAVEGAEGNG